MLVRFAGAFGAGWAAVMNCGGPGAEASTSDDHHGLS